MNLPTILRTRALVIRSRVPSGGAVVGGAVGGGWCLVTESVEAEDIVRALSARKIRCVELCYLSSHDTRSMWNIYSLNENELNVSVRARALRTTELYHHR